MNATKMGYNHAEAFARMQYYGQSANGTISIWIWNSRDGVTPFTTVCQEYAIELQHVNWHKDQFLPDYKPKAGDLIWRDWTKAEAEEFGRKRYKATLREFQDIMNISAEQLIAKYTWDPRETLQRIVDAGEQASIDRAVEGYFVRKAPKLELVKEDWK